MNSYTIYRTIDGMGLGVMKSGDDFATVQAAFTALDDGRQVIDGEQSILSSYFPGGVVTPIAASPITLETGSSIPVNVKALFSNLEGEVGDPTAVRWISQYRVKGRRVFGELSVEDSDLYISWDATGVYFIRFRYFPSLPATFTITVT